MNDFNKNTAFLDSNSTISFLNLQFTISRHIIQRASTTSTAKTFGETTRRARLRNQKRISNSKSKINIFPNPSLIFEERTTGPFSNDILPFMIENITILK